MTEKYTQDNKINENWLSEQIAEKEEKTEEQDIGEIKEQLKITLDLLAGFEEEEITTLLEAHQEE